MLRGSLPVSKNYSSLYLFAIAAVIISLLSSQFLIHNSVAPAGQEIASGLASVFGRFPVQFVPNRGQFEESVRFQADGSGGTLQFVPDGVRFQLPATAIGEEAFGNQTVDLTFLGADPKSEIAAGTALAGQINYVSGADPAAWLIGLPTYGDVLYEQLYPGINLSYEGQEGRLKGTFTVASGADPGLIRWAYSGSQAVAIDDQSGDLIITLPDGSQVVEQAPIAWQDANGERLPVPVSYALADDGSVGFALGSFDKSQPLTIDPTIVYESTINAGSLDHGVDIAVDASGNVFVLAYTYSGQHDVLVAKIDPDGTPLFSTYLGGAGLDYSGGLVVDEQGDVVVAGWTDSADFPVLNPLQGQLIGFRDAFLTRLSGQSGDILYSTFLGGNYVDAAHDVSLGQNGDIYLVGETESTDFPTVNPIQGELSGPAFAYPDAFVTRLSADGGTILYSTYLGGYFEDEGRSIDLDGVGNIFIAGDTKSTDWPTVNPIQAGNGGGTRDVFAARISADGSTLAYSTYLGGEDYDRLGRIEVDEAGNAYLSGATNSIGFPTTPGAYQPTFVGGVSACEVPFGQNLNCYDFFVSKIVPDGSALGYSTFLGGQRDDEGRGLAINDQGEAYVVGYSTSQDFPPNGIISSADIILSKLDASGSNLEYSVTIASGSANAGHGVAVDGVGDIYITGAINVPADVYVAKISEDDQPPSGTVAHVKKIRLSGVTLRDGRDRVTAKVVIRDQDDRPLEGALVTIQMTKPNGKVKVLSNTTNAKGQVYFVKNSRVSGDWTVCVNAIEGEGFTYDPSQNVMTCNTLSYP